jgi:DNA replication protein DnaC
MDLFKLHFLSKNDTSKTLRYMVLVRLIDETFKHIGPIMTFLKHIKRKPSRDVRPPTQDLASESVLLDKRHFHNQVSMKRDWKTKLESFQETNVLVDSVLTLISKLDNIPSLHVIENTQTLINYLEKPFQVTQVIFAKVESIEKDPETGTTSSIDLVLMSNTLSSHEISQWVRRVYELYKEEIKNALGDTLYFFDHKHKSESLDPRGIVHGNDDTEKAKAVHHMMKIMSAPRQLNFVKSPFYSNKSFANIFGAEVREVEERVNFFLNNKDWYDERGIPYQLGLLLSGVPGSGKTSIIRAIANLTKRHIVNVNFANITTATQLKNLFFNEKLSVYTDSTMSSFQVLTIPLEHRIYVLEEIDAISDIVKQRVDGEIKNEPVPDELTLGEILTVLDGTLEVPGRMVIMTSNRPEILDKALIRPGRIDVAVKFGYAKKELIVEMFQSFFGEVFPRELVFQLPNEKLTAAEVGKVLFRNFKNPHPELVVHDLLEYSLETREQFSVQYRASDPVWEPTEELGDKYARWENNCC